MHNPRRTPVQTDYDSPIQTQLYSNRNFSLCALLTCALSLSLSLSLSLDPQSAARHDLVNLVAKTTQHGHALRCVASEN